MGEGVSSRQQASALSTLVLRGTDENYSREGLCGPWQPWPWARQWARLAGNGWPQSHWTDKAHSPEHHFYEKIWWCRNHTYVKTNIAV